MAVAGHRRPGSWSRRGIPGACAKGSPPQGGDWGIFPRNVWQQLPNALLLSRGSLFLELLAVGDTTLGEGRQCHPSGERRLCLSRTEINAPGCRRKPLGANEPLETKSGGDVCPPRGPPDRTAGLQTRRQLPTMAAKSPCATQRHSHTGNPPEKVRSHTGLEKCPRAGAQTLAWGVADAAHDPCAGPSAQDCLPPEGLPWFWGDCLSNREPLLHSPRVPVHHSPHRLGPTLWPLSRTPLPATLASHQGSQTQP